MYGMRFAQIAQDMCNYLDAQTQDLAPREALVAIENDRPQVVSR